MNSNICIAKLNFKTDIIVTGTRIYILKCVLNILIPVKLQ